MEVQIVEASFSAKEQKKSIISIEQAHVIKWASSETGCGAIVAMPNGSFLYKGLHKIKAKNFRPGVDEYSNAEEFWQ